MAKGNTNISGLHLSWRSGKAHDAFRVQVHTKGKTFFISAKIDPTLKAINSYLKINKLKEDRAKRDNHLQSLINTLLENIKEEYGLKVYRSRELINLKTKEFSFDTSLEDFVASKKGNVSVIETYRLHLQKFWLPFFESKGCLHPRDFKQWRVKAELHLRTAKKQKSDEKYSINSYSSMCVALNEYLKFCLKQGDINESQFFSIKMSLSLEQRKRGGSGRSHSRDTYSLKDLVAIKEKIDQTYKNDQEWKLKAYAIYFGICTGLRRGNLLGLKPKDMYPNATPTPYFETSDNIVSGWGRGEVGKATITNATKTFVGNVTLPFVQPSADVLVEVAKYIKENSNPNEYILSCFPDTVGRWWKRISQECRFKFLNPHQWKHSYATIGAAHLGEMYAGNPYFLQKCCLHEKFETTQKYIDQKGKDFLEAFTDARNKKGRAVNR